MQIDTSDEANAPLVQHFRQIWTPDLRVLDPDGFEYDAWQGYWPPAEFTARLLEAAYWRAVCRYKRTHEPEDLLSGWSRTLHTRYPDSQWRTAQSWSEPPLRW